MPHGAGVPIAVRQPHKKGFPYATPARDLAAFLALGGCGYNTFQRTDEQIKANWSEVLNQYQRRADLVPNLVNTVKGEANFEQATLMQVVEARAKATSIQATPDLINDPRAFERFQQAQAQLSGALSRLLVVSENYPALRANQGFRDLQTQLEGTENRITARNRYIQAVQEYNVTVRSFPSNLDGDHLRLPGEAELQRRQRRRWRSLPWWTSRARYQGGQQMTHWLARAWIFAALLTSGALSVSRTHRFRRSPAGSRTSPVR